MSRAKKVNPRRIPVTMAEAKKIGQESANEAIHLAFAIFLMVLLDDFGFDKKQIQLAWERADKLSESIAEKRVNLNDIVRVLRDEYEVLLYK